jgi:hypothetical protein
VMIILFNMLELLLLRLIINMKQNKLPDCSSVNIILQLAELNMKKNFDFRDSQNFFNLKEIQKLTLQSGTEQLPKAVVIPMLLKLDLKGIKLTTNTILRYKDHFVHLAFALTFHKIQGKT